MHTQPVCAIIIKFNIIQRGAVVVCLHFFVYDYNADDRIRIYNIKVNKIIFLKY